MDLTDESPAAAPLDGIDPPPRKATAKKAAAKKAPAKKAATDARPVGRPSKDDQLAAQLSAMLGMSAAGLDMVARARQSEALALDAATVAKFSPDLADSLMMVAKSNAAFRTFIENGVAGGAWTTLMLTMAMMGQELAANHATVRAARAVAAEAEAEAAWVDPTALAPDAPPTS